MAELQAKHQHKRFSLAQRVTGEGFNSMSHFVELSGESHQTLINWSKNYPDRFGYLLAGIKLKHKIFKKAVNVQKVKKAL